MKLTAEERKWDSFLEIETSRLMKKYSNEDWGAIEKNGDTIIKNIYKVALNHSVSLEIAYKIHMFNKIVLNKIEEVSVAYLHGRHFGEHTKRPIEGDFPLLIKVPYKTPKKERLKVAGYEYKRTDTYGNNHYYYIGTI